MEGAYGNLRQLARATCSANGPPREGAGTTNPRDRATRHPLPYIGM
jgi:hypothetical protein